MGAFESVDDGLRLVLNFQSQNTQYIDLYSSWNRISPIDGQTPHVSEGRIKQDHPLSKGTRSTKHFNRALSALAINSPVPKSEKSETLSRGRGESFD